MAEIQLPHGLVTMVDDSDFEWLNQWNWSKCGSYVARTGRKSDGMLRGKTIKMHRQIMGVNDSLIQVDHRDRNKLNNHLRNLRLCSKSENACNVLLQSNSSSGYKGVEYRNGLRVKNHWMARIMVSGKVKYLGHYSTKEQAAVAYNQAAIKYFGEFACLNEIQL